jgi:hypothetical protein
MGQQEYNEWWFNHYCEMGVSGFPDPRENDDYYYEVWKEQREEMFNESFTYYFESRFDL